MKSWRFKILMLLLAGCVTPLMQLFVPIGGGGISLIFVLSVPILLGLSLLLSLTIWLLNRKTERTVATNYVFYIGLLVLNGLALMAYPYV